MSRYAIITREFTFEASHHLPNHKGKCRRPHGHSYRLQISLRGPIKEAPGQSDEGMVMDFDDLKCIVNSTIIEELSDSAPRGRDAQPVPAGGMDHNDLNALTGIRTTAEGHLLACRAGSTQDAVGLHIDIACAYDAGGLWTASQDVTTEFEIARRRFACLASHGGY